MFSGMFKKIFERVLVDSELNFASESFFLGLIPNRLSDCFAKELVQSLIWTGLMILNSFEKMGS